MQPRVTTLSFQLILTRIDQVDAARRGYIAGLTEYQEATQHWTWMMIHERICPVEYEGVGCGWPLSPTYLHILPLTLASALSDIASILVSAVLGLQSVLTWLENQY